MSDQLLDICTACGHLRGEHLINFEGKTSHCLIQDCRCIRFREALDERKQRKQPKREHAWRTTYKRCR